MNPTREEALLALALTKPATERVAWLDRECAGDPALRQRLDTQLMAQHQPENLPAIHEGGERDRAQNAEAGSAPPGKGTTEITPTLLDQPLLTEGPGTVIGRYKLLEQIGEGGFGVVYVAEQREPVRRQVALKIIKLGMDTRQVVARFEAERQALALMDHPNIAKVFDAGATDSGRPFFVMELVKGIPITKYCDQEKLGTRNRLDLFIGVCQAIQHAHQKGIIHRDIKPSNILVTVQEGKPVPKVIDFGIAKATQQRLTEKTLHTQMEQFIGTPAYMSPEQAEMSGLDIDTRSDIYSLGVLLYELLVGKTPFDSKELLAAGLDEIRRTIREEDPVRPSTRLSLMPQEELTTTTQRRGAEAPKLISLVRGDLDWIVMKCLEKDRTRRYDTANGLAMDIQRHLSCEPVLARPPSRLYEFQKTVRRHKFGFAATAAIIILLVIGSTLTTWQAVRATRAQEREANARLRADRAARLAESESQRAEKEEQKAKASELAAREAAEAARRNLYAADINLAYQAWQENNLGAAIELLNRHRPEEKAESGKQTAETDLRGWEWRYLWRLCRSEALYTFGQYSNLGTASMFAVAISRHDRYLATVGPGGEARLWDIASRRAIEVLETDDALPSVAFSPDGSELAFATRHHGVRLWSIQRRREIARFPLEPASTFDGPTLGFSPDSRQLAVGGGDGRVTVWDLATRTVGLTLDGHSGAIHALVLSPDGRTLITAPANERSDFTIRVWSLVTGQQLAALTNNTSRIGGVALSPDGTTLATGDWDGRIRIWDLAEHREVAVLTNHTWWISALAFSPDGKTMASASADWSIRLWETRHWQEVRMLKGSQDEVWAIAFSSDGKTLFSGTRDGKILVWDARPRSPRAQVLRRPDNADEFSLLLPGGVPFCLHSNHAFNLWEPQTLRKLPDHPVSESEPWADSSRVTLGPEMEHIAVVTQSGRIDVLDLEGNLQFSLPGLLPETQVLRFSPDGKLLAAAAAGKGVRVWNLERREILATLPKSNISVTAGPCFTTNAQMIAVGNDDGTVEVWSIARNKLLSQWQAHNGGVPDLAFLPDGNKLVTVSWDNQAKLWDVETQRELVRFGRALNTYNSVAVSPDGQRIVAGTANGLIRIWNSTTGQELLTLKGLNDWIDPSRSGRWLITGVGGLAFPSPDGNTLISSTHGEVRLWRAPSWEEIEAAEAKVRKEAGPH